MAAETLVCDFATLAGQVQDAHAAAELLRNLPIAGEKALEALRARDYSDEVLRARDYSDEVDEEIELGLEDVPVLLKEATSIAGGILRSGGAPTPFAKLSPDARNGVASEYLNELKDRLYWAKEHQDHLLEVEGTLQTVGDILGREIRSAEGSCELLQSAYKYQFEVEAARLTIEDILKSWTRPLLYVGATEVCSPETYYSSLIAKDEEEFQKAKKLYNEHFHKLTPREQQEQKVAVFHKDNHAVSTHVAAHLWSHVLTGEQKERYEKMLKVSKFAAAD